MVSDLQQNALLVTLEDRHPVVCLILVVLSPSNIQGHIRTVLTVCTDGDFIYYSAVSTINIILGLLYHDTNSKSIVSEWSSTIKPSCMHTIIEWSSTIRPS